MSNLTRPELVWRLAESERECRQLKAENDKLRRELEVVTRRRSRQSATRETADSRYPG